MSESVPTVLRHYVENRAKRFKGTDLASIDPKSGRLVRLFNSRADKWNIHFRFVQGQILPRTAKGRVTAFILKFNLPKRIATRKLLSIIGDYPGKAD
jgi:hypothetical protein